MADSKSTAAVTGSVIKQVNFAVSEITEIAIVIRRNAIESVQLVSGEDCDVLENLIIANAHLASQIGYISDLISSKLKGNMVHESADGWFMPPAYHHECEENDVEALLQMSDDTK